MKFNWELKRQKTKKTIKKNEEEGNEKQVKYSHPSVDRKHQLKSSKTSKTLQHSGVSRR